MRTTLPLLAGLALSASALAQPLEPPEPKRGPESGVSSDRLLESIKQLPTKRSSWGDDAHRKGLRDAEKQLTDALTALGLKPQLDPVDSIGHRVQDHEEGLDAPFNNIIVDLPGTTARDEIVILSAHIDAVPKSPGADDDGSGIAVLLEAARLLKDYPTQRSIRLILFNLEENGLVGSRIYTSRLKADMEAGKLGAQKIVGMVSMDMLGFYSDAPNSQQSPIKSFGNFKVPTVGDFVGMAGLLRFRPFSQALDKAMKKAEPSIKTVVVDFFPIAPPDLLRSDHAPFLAIGIPAVILADTANFRNPNYHKATDTIDTLDMPRLTIAARGVIGGIHLLAGPPGTPLINIAPLSPSPTPPTPPIEPAKPDEAPVVPAPTTPPGYQRKKTTHARDEQVCGGRANPVDSRPRYMGVWQRHPAPAGPVTIA